ncbi:anaerobic ribonucleoside-triphosphate reductase [Streptobacillus moniliformis]|uniref:Anaerobic ribonucleoside-triphosphate reductase n=1 Tax=Streptobacillus moniliformis (strain ATCC 14647 / DSM 12112 / NCTC 10651 / 9901) TaxID=519441 RepID=D1AVC7_STRM9|nr:anaerobic ribonucleoside-triphosphate reductase [Streptobacillus moniliformis]ACZ01687.1 anaerobic ribonucleoside-triphosphate reductase [Streptobacillus moniliformis DSM 12112]AVL43314.1 anaerobic ribonucleoside-triphosphate reductase [Streptobacillus moniliformis]QXW66362.1 anaerobic ribonucleoside-triphosphate reductase [Streptobacillus moniliformis]SQA13134.1 Anaerobic ribonucleoside-triphosphate reductase [Streptobacillus moniliformis]
MNILKRDGREEKYDSNKIRDAINKANETVELKERICNKKIEEIIQHIENEKISTVEEIQDFIEKSLVSEGLYKLAKNYIVYRYTRSLVRKANTTDESILALIQNSNKDVQEENSNKNSVVASTQRDLIAGEVSKDLTRRIILPEHISKAHDEGILHFHDADYFIQNIFNCCLVNIKDMLENGTVMNAKLVESPKSFQVACTVLTQIIAAVASGQYGGQSIDIRHLGKYLRVSRDKYMNKYREKYKNLDEKTLSSLVEDRIRDELKSGVQTIQYQINTLMTTNGQSPFVTLFLYLRDDDEYKEEVADIIEEILNQRIQGIKNDQGVYVTSAFPKLVYVLDENNALKGGKYDYLTRLAVECTSKRMYPDYISAKIMKKNYEGNVFSPMGCRSFLSPYKDNNGEYKFEGRFNQGVVSLNLVQIALVAKTEEKYFELLEDRLKLCYEALMLRHNKLKGTTSDISPIHWQYGAIARLKKGEKIDEYLMNGYSTISLGYIGIYETTKLITGKSHTTKEGTEFALKLMNKLEDATIKWKKETGIGFGLYGTPAESLCYRFARIDKEKFGIIEDITDKGYYTNSYHVDVRENISVFDKFNFESEFQKISSGGAISYAEIPNMSKNIDALEEMVKYIYDNIQYAEFNTKTDYCHVCGFDEEMVVNNENNWECPQCHNNDKTKMNVIRRTCGYLGENFWNEGKTKEISKRVLHI